MDHFITETELAAAKTKRQEEWEKVRAEGETEEEPTVQYDSRSLFARLQEQKESKDLEFDESKKLKNLVRGLDDDEVQFLDLVDHKKIEADRQQQMEEIKEIIDFREQISSLQEKILNNKIQQEISREANKTTLSTNRLSQKDILTKSILKKRKISNLEAPRSDSRQKIIATATTTLKPTRQNNKTEICKPNNAIQKSALQCIGILPGIDYYTSDSESESENCQFDWVGRKLCAKDGQHNINC